MNYRTLGKTGIRVSEIGLGCWQIGDIQDGSLAKEQEALEVLTRAMDMGCNFFDTAPNYGYGKSEALIGRFIQGRRDRVVINTKFGHHPDDIQDFSAERIRESVEESLERLKTVYIDSVLLHNPPLAVLENREGHFDILEELKRKGKIRAYGASVDTPEEMAAVLDHSGSEVMEVFYNIFHQETAREFARAAAKGVGIIVKIPLDSGWLSGKYHRGTVFTDIRSRWGKADIERRVSLLEKLDEVLEQPEDLSGEALRFVLQSPEVSTVIPGGKTASQAERNLKAGDESMSGATAERLRNFWKREIEPQPLPW